MEHGEQEGFVKFSETMSEVLAVARKSSSVQQDSESGSKRKEDDSIAEAMRSLLPDGPYDAVCYKVTSGKCWGNRKSIYLNFRIYGGQFKGAELFMACPYYKKYNLRHKYFQQWVVAAGRLPVRGERMSYKPFRSRMFRIKVRTVERKFDDGTPMPEDLLYSIVDRIVEPLTGAFSTKGHE